MSEYDILHKYRSFGRITTCSMNGGFCIIEFEEEDSAVHAIEETH